MLFRDFWGQSKREELLNSLSVKPFDTPYTESQPAIWNKLSLRPRAVDPRYLTWPSVPELADIAPINGLMEKRGGALINVSAAELSKRMQAYYDSSIDWSAFKLLGNPLANDAGRFNAAKARSSVISAEKFDSAKVVRYFLRPFDIRFAYYSATRPLWNEPRPALWNQYTGGNRFLVCRRAAVAVPEGVPFGFTRCLGDNDAVRGHAYYVPFRKRESLTGQQWPNLSKLSQEYLKLLGYDLDKLDACADLIWQHVLAVGFSTRYLSDNADGVAIDWPRIPLPQDKKKLENSAALGRELASLLDTENDVAGVTSGNVQDQFLVTGTISDTALAVTAGWGRVDKEGKIFPGRGKIEIRAWSTEEWTKIENGLNSIGLCGDSGHAALGRAVDVYLNDNTKWIAIPEAVWELHLGGYQVLKKWLSYREYSILGRQISKEEAREFTKIVRRLTAIALMANRLDANYVAVRDASSIV